MKRVSLSLAYRGQRVSQMVRTDALDGMARRGIRGIPMEHPGARAWVTTQLLDSAKVTLSQPVGTNIDIDPLLELAAIFVDPETIRVAETDHDVDEIRVEILDTTQLREGYHCPDLKIGAYQSAEPHPPRRPSNVMSIADGAHRHFAVKWRKP